MRTYLQRRSFDAPYSFQAALISVQIRSRKRCAGAGSVLTIRLVQGRPAEG